jgi:hypothetical protein
MILDGTVTHFVSAMGATEGTIIGTSTYLKRKIIPFKLWELLVMVLKYLVLESNTGIFT